MTCAKDQKNRLVRLQAHAPDASSAKSKDRPVVFVRSERMERITCEEMKRKGVVFECGTCAGGPARSLTGFVLRRCLIVVLISVRAVQPVSYRSYGG